LDKEELLRPTLSEYRQVPALYSSTGFFLASFFGGPVGAAFYGLCNSQRLNRLWHDMPVILAAASAAFVVIFLLHSNGQTPAIAELMGAAPRRALEITLRALALAVFGAIYLLHRKFYRAARVSGMKSVSSWVPGIASLLLGIWANSAFIRWILAHH
jgi:hypothetical protein